MPELYIPPAPIITAQIQISQRLICDLFCTIIESPPMQWMEGIYLVKSNPEIKALQAFKKETGERESNLVWYGHPEIYNEALEIKVVYDDPDDEEGSYEGLKFIKWDDIAKGFQLMAEKAPYAFGQLMDGDATNWDANTADTLAQFIVLGSEVYG